MAEGMDLDPQLRDFLETADMLSSIGDGSNAPIDQLRDNYEEAYRYCSKAPGMQLDALQDASAYSLANCY